MSFATDRAFQSAIDEMSVAGILVGHRVISPGDEDALLPEEAALFASSVLEVRRSSGAARIVARQLLRRLGHPEVALPRTRSEPPVWPDGLVGSLAHDSRFALAALGYRRDFEGLGIDVEPAEMLPADLIDLVATRYERQKLA